MKLNNSKNNSYFQSCWGCVNEQQHGTSIKRDLFKTLKTKKNGNKNFCEFTGEGP